MADTLRVAALSSLNYMLSMLRLNLKPRLYIEASVLSHNDGRGGERFWFW